MESFLVKLFDFLKELQNDAMYISGLKFKSWLLTPSYSELYLFKCKLYKCKFSDNLKPSKIDEIVWKTIFIFLVKNMKPKCKSGFKDKWLNDARYSFKRGKQVKKSNAFYVV